MSYPFDVRLGMVIFGRAGDREPLKQIFPWHTKFQEYGAAGARMKSKPDYELNMEGRLENKS